MKLNYKYLSMAAILIYVVLALAAINAPFRLDEVTNVQAAQAIVKTGLPVHYEHELEPAQLSLWHPPFYLYILALSFKIFGVSEASARLVSLIFGLLTLWVVSLMAKQLFRQHLPRLFVLGFLALNPFFIKHSLLISNEAVLVFFEAMFLLFVVKWI